jgi:hypothetical protein
MLYPIASPLESKLKYWICTTAADYPPWTAWLPLSTATKKIISTLITLTTTQSCLHFVFSLTKALRHWSSTHCRRSLSSLSHAYHFFTQWHTWWWTSWPFFTFWTTYWYVNSRKNIFWNITVSCGVINEITCCWWCNWRTDSLGPVCLCMFVCAFFSFPIAWSQY